MATSVDCRHSFCGYRLDAVTRELFGPDGTSVALTSKTFDVLLQLIEHRGRVLGKDELLAAVWPGRVVEENNLTQAISALRKALGGGAGDHRYIITVPWRGYRFVAALDQPDGTSRAAETTTLAVLPFRPIGVGNGDDGIRDEMLELGMAETLIARLSRSTSLQVLSLGSVQGFVGAKVDPLQAGMTLGADYVVGGSTQQCGGFIRVNARLLSLPDGKTVWAGTYDQMPDRVFTLQDVLAEAVSSALSLEYTATTGYSSPGDGTDSVAYRAYLRGRYLINRPDAKRLPTAIAAFQEAIDRDPACARAWAGIANANLALVMTGDRDPRELFPRAHVAVAQALAIDPGSAYAYSVKGYIQFWYDWDWAGAEASLRHALALDANLAEAHYTLAELLTNIGREAEAVPHARQVALLDPLSPLANTLAARDIASAGHVDEGRQRLEKVLELEPDFWIALLMRGAMTLGTRDYPQAISDLRRAAELSGNCTQVLTVLGQAFVLAGDRGAAEHVLHDMELCGRTGYMPATSLAALHNALGDSEGALDLLEQAHRERDVRMSFLKVDARWNNLRGQPRFQALMRHMDL